MALLTPVRPSVSFARDLAAHGDRLAVVAHGRQISYRRLADRVADTAAALGPERRLVAIATSNHLEPLVAYLAALQAGHPALLVPGGDPQRLANVVAAYDPDVVVAGGEDGGEDGGGNSGVTVRRSGSAHELHPDLALLLSTSGSTGSSKLVRLSHRNLDANAAAIARYLDIDDGDRAITSLPMHYCYGLSVLNSHLLSGAGIVLTSTSVVDPCFWDAFRRHGATSFAGVPHTFDLLDRAGFEDMRLPSLRYVTQAGGRLAPEKVRRYARMGEQRGWRLFVMYGQTEATARMAYLPPDLAVSHPRAIGRPIPGGSFTLEPTAGTGDQPDQGELVYHGPNVMLGYAHGPADLAEGATVGSLRTGDLARRTADGLYEVIGRRSRFLKLFGLRVDLDQVEHLLRHDGVDATCTGDDDALVVAVGTVDDARRVPGLVAGHLGLPGSRVQVGAFSELPRLANGKPDLPTIVHAVRSGDADCGDSAGDGGSDGDQPDGAPPGDRSVHDLFARVLQRADVTDDSTFVSLGGDSLSYVETSIRLEQLLGHLPADWHVTPVGRLTPAEHRPRLVSHVETNVVLRALAIVFVVATHAELLYLPGGAHVLLAVAGYNFARFQLAGGHMLRSIARIALPSMVLIGLIAAARDEFVPAHALLVNGQFGPTGADTALRFWFVEALVQLLVVLAAVLAVPALRRAEAAHPLGFPTAVLAAGLLIRFDLVPHPELSYPHFRPHEVIWLFAAGWVAARATSWPQRLALSAAVVAAAPGFVEQPVRVAVLATGVLLLVWVPRMAVVWPVNRLVGVVAGASLYVYLTHSDVYPLLTDHAGRPVAVAVAIVVGIAVWSIVQRTTTAVESRLHERMAGDLRARAAPSGGDHPGARWDDARLPAS